MYDQNNIFAKILRKELSATILYEDKELIAIEDINPAANIHILIITKHAYSDFNDFVTKSTSAQISHYFKIIAQLARDNKINDYRLITNKGKIMGQSVFHFHTHLLSGTISNLN